MQALILVACSIIGADHPITGSRAITDNSRCLPSQEAKILFKRSTLEVFQPFRNSRFPNTAPKDFLGLIGGFFIRWPGIPKDSSIFVPAGPALSRPALCHVTCFVICYTNRTHIAQVLQATFHKKKFMHHRCCMVFTSGTTEDTEERRGVNHKGHEGEEKISNFGNSGDYGNFGNFFNRANPR